MSESKAPVTEQPDILEVVYWLQNLKDPIERIKKATLFGDEARDQLLPELASVRRLATVEARQKLMNQGLTATEATRALASEVGMSVQTVNRMISERKAYGG